jgi:hypothetical protein
MKVADQVSQASTADPLAPILLRALSVGALLGSLAAALFGIAASSVGLVVYGPIVGALIGALVGVANGLELVAIANLTRSRLVLRLGAAFGSAISASGLAALAGRLDEGAGLIFVGSCVGAGAIVGPFVAYGPRARIDVPLGPIAAGGAVAGSTTGSIAGLAIGIAIDPVGLIPVALVEGGLLGAVPGSVLALITVPPVVWLRRRSRESD